MIFLFLLIQIAEEPADIFKKWNFIFGGYAISWAATFIVPRASGGLGILITLLGDCLSALGLLLGLLLFRVINTVGDLLFYSAALLKTSN